jgi:hypothetical protein
VNQFKKNKSYQDWALATTAAHTDFHKTAHRASISQTTGSIQGAKTGSYNNTNDPTYPGPDGKMFTWKRDVALHLAQTRLPKKSVHEHIDLGSEIFDLPPPYKTAEDRALGPPLRRTRKRRFELWPLRLGVPGFSTFWGFFVDLLQILLRAFC